MLWYKWKRKFSILSASPKAFLLLLTAFSANDLQFLDSDNGSLSQSSYLKGDMSFFLGGKEEGKQNKMKTSACFVKAPTFSK